MVATDNRKLLLIPQRYEFSSKSQLGIRCTNGTLSCCWYHKGTNFQANHNHTCLPLRWQRLLLIPQRYEFSSKSQQRVLLPFALIRCCWYHKGTNFQANHNLYTTLNFLLYVVADTTKVRIFKQITTFSASASFVSSLLLIPQRYEFSSKSQPVLVLVLLSVRCCWYHKGTNFQANHNYKQNIFLFFLLLLIPQRYEFSSKSQLFIDYISKFEVVADTTKVRIFKQITTKILIYGWKDKLLLIPQRYEFSSKSQLHALVIVVGNCCCWYHKGTNFQANHNGLRGDNYKTVVVADTTKVRIFKQITTNRLKVLFSRGCCWYHKGTNFQANHNPNSGYCQGDDVVADTTKVRIFKQITTSAEFDALGYELLLIPQRYEFSSKSQLLLSFA